MDCFICNGPANIKDGEGGEKLIQCDYCGDYRISNVARDVLIKAQVPLNKGGMLVILARKRSASAEVPLIKEIDLVYDRDQLAG